MVFNQNQLKELFDIIETYHLIFISSNVGTSVLTDKDKELLKNAGVNLNSFPEYTLLDYSFKFGVLAEALGDKRTKELSYKDFKNYIKKGNFIPLTDEEENAVERVKYQAYSDIKNLGNKIERELAQKNIESELKSSIEDRKLVVEMAHSLAKKTDDWNRDFGRISDYLMHSVYEEGRAQSLINKYGENVEVYKEVMPQGACKHCIRLYLTNGLGSQPRIFKLKDLIANGSNIGRKVNEYKATLGPLHPWCRCTLSVVPSDFIWNEETQGFTTPKKWTRRVERRSKVKIQIGNKIEYI